MAKKRSNTTGNPCSICTHDNVKEINKAIADGKTLRPISTRWLGHERHYTAIYRHIKNCLKLDFAAARRDEITSKIAFDFGTELHKLYDRAQKMVAAVEAWLTDAENPEAFDIGPRDTEILVTYLDHKDLTEQGKPRRKKATLNDLLERVEADESYEVMSVASMAVDNRKLYLEGLKTMNDRLEQFAKFYGLYQNPRDNEQSLQKVLQSFSLWVEKNPQASAVEKGDAIQRFARGGGVPADVLAEKAGIQLIEQVQ